MKGFIRTLGILLVMLLVMLTLVAIGGQNDAFVRLATGLPVLLTFIVLVFLGCLLLGIIALLRSVSGVTAPVKPVTAGELVIAAPQPVIDVEDLRRVLRHDLGWRWKRRLPWILLTGDPSEVELAPDLIPRAMQLVEKDRLVDYLLRLSASLRQDATTRLMVFFQPLFDSGDRFTLHGVVFSLPQMAGVSPYVYEQRMGNVWQGIAGHSKPLRGRQIGLSARSVLFWFAGALLALGCVGILFSWFSNAQLVRQAHEPVTQSGSPLQRLSALQTVLSTLEGQQHHGTPWYRRFGMDISGGLPPLVWPQYQALATPVIAKPTQRTLQQQLTTPSGDNTADYNRLKTLLMLASPERAEDKPAQQFLVAQQLATSVFTGTQIDNSAAQLPGRVHTQLGNELKPMTTALFVAPLGNTWRDAMRGGISQMNQQWQQQIVADWNTHFAGKYPLSNSNTDSNLAELGEFIDPQTGKIAAFIRQNLSGVLTWRDGRWHSMGNLPLNYLLDAEPDQNPLTVLSLKDFRLPVLPFTGSRTGSRHARP